MPYPRPVVTGSAHVPRGGGSPLHGRDARFKSVGIFSPAPWTVAPRRKRGSMREGALILAPACAVPLHGIERALPSLRPSVPEKKRGGPREP